MNTKTNKLGHVLGHVRGFTLIELLVVIAIIGILASVVLASLNTARDKGADAAIKSQINNSRAQAELYYENNNRTYTTVCSSGSSNIDFLLDSAELSGGTNRACADTANSWAASMQLKSSTQFYCVDSTGNATTTAAVGIADATDCVCGTTVTACS
jgi:prepilin-type N-terminal cleavage/methylation domain-containing protein